jgi:hypothetical protein
MPRESIPDLLLKYRVTSSKPTHREAMGIPSGASQTS